MIKRQIIKSSSTKSRRIAIYKSVKHRRTVRSKSAKLKKQVRSKLMIKRATTTWRRMNCKARSTNYRPISRPCLMRTLILKSWQRSCSPTKNSCKKRQRNRLSMLLLYKTSASPRTNRHLTFWTVWENQRTNANPWRTTSSTWSQESPSTSQLRTTSSTRSSLNISIHTQIAKNLKSCSSERQKESTNSAPSASWSKLKGGHFKLKLAAAIYRLMSS